MIHVGVCNHLLWTYAKLVFGYFSFSITMFVLSTVFGGHCLCVSVVDLIIMTITLKLM